jgi:hypothetical protein
MTGDTHESEGAWNVNYMLGTVLWEHYIRDINYVRPVRSVK